MIPRRSVFVTGLVLFIAAVAPPAAADRAPRGEVVSEAALLLPVPFGGTGFAAVGVELSPTRRGRLYPSLLGRVGVGYATQQSVSYELIDTSDGYLSGGYVDERIPPRLGLGGDVAVLLNLDVQGVDQPGLVLSGGIGAFASWFFPLRTPPTPPDTIPGLGLPTRDFRLSYDVNAIPSFIPVAILRLQLRVATRLALSLDVAGNPKFGTVAISLRRERKTGD